jgi:drug/metabolite transporter (DMT)-like permease
VNLQFAKTAFAAVMYVGWFLVDTALIHKSAVAPKRFSDWVEALAPLWPGYGGWQVWLLLAYSAIGPGVLADILQQSGQKIINATEANVILTTETVFASVFAFVLLGEAVSPKEGMGGLLILVAALISSR